jgi:hypothetical protein
MISEQPALPILPYKGTSGHSGSDTSRERAEREDRDGTTESRQDRTYLLLHAAGRKGLTWKELSEITGWHHGQSSGVLSVLHKVGGCARLVERRNKCAVYVLPYRFYTDGREVAVRKVKCCKNCGAEQ